MEAHLKGKPILFSGPMIRALLAGTKTQTRRIIKPQPKLAPHHEPVRVERRGERGWVWMVCTDRPSYQFATGDWKSPCAEGDRLYVREHWRTWAQYDDIAPRGLAAGTHVAYEATDNPNLGSNGGRFRQGMHMPKWASRVTLVVTEVRVERLQDISEADALAEGIMPWNRQYPFGLQLGPDAYCLGKTAVQAYRALWNHINGAGSWDANPWCAAYSFDVLLGNIDQLEAA